MAAGAAWRCGREQSWGRAWMPPPWPPKARLGPNCPIPDGVGEGQSQPCREGSPQRHPAEWEADMPAMRAVRGRHPTTRPFTTSDEALVNSLHACIPHTTLPLQLAHRPALQCRYKRELSPKQSRMGHAGPHILSPRVCLCTVGTTPQAGSATQVKVHPERPGSSQLGQGPFPRPHVTAGEATPPGPCQSSPAQGWPSPPKQKCQVSGAPAWLKRGRPAADLSVWKPQPQWPTSCALEPAQLKASRPPAQSCKLSKTGSPWLACPHTPTPPGQPWPRKKQTLPTHLVRHPTLRSTWVL